MNRAILIVICDFLVSAMLSMMTGMVPAHTGGTGVGLDENTTRTLLQELDTHRRELEKLRLKLREAVQKFGSSPEREAELNRLASEIAANLQQREKVVTAAESTPQNTGKLSPEELQKRLEQEQRRRIAAELRLKDNRSDLQRTRTELQKNDAMLAKTRSDLDKTQTSLRETAGALVDLSREHVKTQRDLAAASARLKSESGKLKQREADLSGAREALKEINARLGQAKEETHTLQTTLAFQSGKLNTTEQELASLQGELKRVRSTLATRELERTEARRQRDEMAGVVKRVVADLSAARSELEKTRREFNQSNTKAAVLSAKLSSAEQRLRSKDLRNEALSNYSTAALRLVIRYAEKRVFETQQGGGTYFLPLVNFGGKILLPGSLQILSGAGEKEMNHRKIVELKYTVTRPDARSAAERTLPGPLLIYPGDPQIAALPAAGFADRKPLQLITYEELRERGVKNLYLFKGRSFGRDSAELTGRCSMDLASAHPFLYITNAGHGTGAVLRAEPGDFILTHEGQFVGIVVEDRSRDFGRIRQARAVLFPAGAVWTKAQQLPLRQQKDSPYYGEFGQRLQELRKRLETEPAQ